MILRFRTLTIAILTLTGTFACFYAEWVQASFNQISELIQIRKIGSTSKYERPHQVHGAVTLHITERGQSYFKDDLADAVYRVSQAFTPKAINPTEGKLKDLEMKYAEPLDMQSLSEKVAQPFEDLKNQIHLWLNDKYLQGVALNVPQPLIQLKNLDYQVKYSKLSVKFLDPKDQTSPQDTFRILLEIEVPRLQVNMNELTVKDLQNNLFGTFGSKSPSLALNSELLNHTEPLKISAEVTLQNVSTGINAKISQIDSNLETVLFDLGYKPLILPSIKVSTNSNNYTINNTKLNQYLDNNIPALLKSFQHFALEFVNNEFLSKTNSSLESSLAKGIGSMDIMPPPGAPDLLPQSDYLKYGLSIFSTEKIGPTLSIHMMGFAEDPKNLSLNSEMSKTDLHVYPAQLTSLASDRYDLAMALNENFLNQLLYLSYKRGYFNDIVVGDKNEKKPTHIRLASQPIIRFKDGEARLSLHVATRMTGIATIAVKKDIEAKFDVLLGIEKNARGGFKVLIKGTDVKSGFIDQKFIKALKRVVRKQFAKYLNQANKEYKTKPSVLAEHIPVPSELFGIPLVVEAGYPENSGNFVIYLSLDREQIELDKQDRRVP